MSRHKYSQSSLPTMYIVYAAPVSCGRGTRIPAPLAYLIAEGGQPLTGLAAGSSPKEIQAVRLPYNLGGISVGIKSVIIKESSLWRAPLEGICNKCGACDLVGHAVFEISTEEVPDKESRGLASSKDCCCLSRR